MTMTIATLPTPLRVHDGGIVRVGNTRVSLDTVVYAHLDGATPEEIVDRYPTLDLADTYAAVSYFLRNRAQVDAYLREREALADQIRAELEERFPSAGLRERLLARLANRDA